MESFLEWVVMQNVILLLILQVHTAFTNKDIAFSSVAQTPTGNNMMVILNCQAFELAHVQMMEEAFCVQQLLMGSLFNDLAVFNDNDLVCIADGG